MKIEGVQKSIGAAVELPLGESPREWLQVSGFVEHRAPQGFGTQPPIGNYLVMSKPVTVNGTKYDALYLGEATSELTVGRAFSGAGEVYEVSKRVVEGTQRYAVLAKPVAIFRNQSGRF